LLCEIRDRVAVITLNRPEARNALSDRLTPALRRMIKQCGDDPNVGALLITGTGTAFCAGGDVKGMGNNSNKTEMTFEERVADLRTKQRTLTGVLVAVRKPTVAALPGPAAGAGMAPGVTGEERRAAGADGNLGRVTDTPRALQCVGLLAPHRCAARGRLKERRVARD